MRVQTDERLGGTRLIRWLSGRRSGTGLSSQGAALRGTLLLFAVCSFTAGEIAPPPLDVARSLADSGQYDEAVRALRNQRGRLDAQEKELLARCLYFRGDRMEALEVWNSIGEPVLDHIEFTIPAWSSQRFLERELGAEPGRLLEVRRLETGVRVLQDAGLRVIAQPTAAEEGHGGLDIVYARRKGPFSSWLRFGAWGAASSIARSTTIPFYDIDGHGTSIAVGGRWAMNRRMAQMQISFLTTRPLLVRETLYGRFEQRLLAPIVEPEHQSNTEVWRSTAGAEAAIAVSRSSDVLVGVGYLRRYGTVGDSSFIPSSYVQPMIGVRFSRRPQSDQPAGSGSAEELRPGWTYLAEARVTYSRNLGHTAPDFTRAIVRASLDIPLARRLRYVIAGHGQAVTNQAPPDELVLAGVGTGGGYVLPMRGHPLYEGGVAGIGPIGYRGVAFQSTLLYRLYSHARYALWAESFVDEGRLWRRIDPSIHRGWLTDVGAGLRLSLPGNLTVGIRRGYALTDHQRVFSAYIGEQF